MTVYVIVEHDNQQVKPSTFSTLSAASQLGDDISAIILGNGCKKVANELAECESITQVLLLEDEVYQHPLAERFCSAIIHTLKNPQYLLAPATTFGKNLLPRIAAKLDVPQVSDVVEILDKVTFKRPIYAGNALETVRVLKTPICLTIRTTAFPAVKKIRKNNLSIKTIDFISKNQQSQMIKKEVHTSNRPELASAKIVLSGGRGLKNKTGFERMVKIADRLGAAVGATRAAVDTGLAPNDWQVGQTGQTVAPKLYFALGISGAIQHLAGMKDSGIIVAINNDPDAPIFQIATYGLVADLNDIIPAWENLLKEMGY